MPKVKPTAFEEKQRLVRAYVIGNQQKYAISNEQAAMRAKFTERTFRNRLRHPEKFTLEELWALGCILKFDDQEKIGML